MGRLKIDVTPSLQRLDLVVKGLVNTKYIGSYASVFKGTGLEFADFRAYTPSDDASLIDWVASNRARKLLVKEFVEERNINVYFLVDVSSKMMLGTIDKLKCEYVAELVASFSNTILRAGDFVGVAMFAENIKKNIVSVNEMNQFHIISDALSNLDFYGGGSSIKNALDYALKNFSESSLVFLVSDFISDEDFSEELKLAARKFDLIGVMVRDPIDLELPEGQGQVLIENPSTGERMLISPNKYRGIYAQEVKKEIATFEKSFRNIGADFLFLDTTKSFVKELVMFFERRKMQWK